MVVNSKVKIHPNIFNFILSPKSEDHILACGQFGIQCPAVAFPMKFLLYGPYFKVLNNECAVFSRHSFNPILQQITAFLLSLQSSDGVVFSIDAYASFALNESKHALPRHAVNVIGSCQVR